MAADPPVTSSTSLGTWLGLEQRERWYWWDERWHEAIGLSERYRLTLRSGWWEDSLRVEAIAAFAAWLAAYDTEQNDDPPGKLHLLAQLDWLNTALRGGQRAFDPVADRPAFDQHLRSLGCRPPDHRPIPDPPPNPKHARHRDEVAAELQATATRLRELKARERSLRAACRHDPARRGDHAQRDLALLHHTITQLGKRQRNLRRQLRAVSSQQA